MNFLIFHHFSLFFQHVFFSLNQNSIAPEKNAIFTYITIIVSQNQLHATLLNFDAIYTFWLAVHIHAKKSTKSTILFYLKKQSEYFCKNMEIIIHADAHADIVYQFALYQLNTLKKVITAKPNGTQATIQVLGKYLMQEKSNFHCNTYQYHELPNTKSSVLIEGISLKQSSVVHKGFIFIAPQAIHTNAKQSSRHITLTKNTFVHAEPILDVQNNNVTCAHASAIGTVSKEAIFYLTARGINKQTATFLVIQSFALLKPTNQQDYAFHAYTKQLLQATMPLE